MAFSRNLIRWLRDYDNLLVLFVAFIIVFGVWAFLNIADEVAEGETDRFDNWAVRALRMPDPDNPTGPQVPLGPRWLREMGRDITALGGVAVLMLVTAGVAGYLLMAGKHHAMWLVLIAVIGGAMIGGLLKDFFDRPRPSVDHYSYVTSSSFPSGHSMMSAVVYLTLGSLLARMVPQRRIKVYFVVLALTLTFVIGFSRVYMGVHYPTDVLAGWAAGLAWAMICWIVARHLQKRGTVERDIDPPC